VVSGDVAGGFAATSHLFEAGQQRIRRITGEDCLKAARDRLKGGHKAPATWEALLDPRRVAAGAAAPNGREQAGRLLDLPIALFFCCDDMARGAYGAGGARGLRVPEYLSIVDFDDAPLSPAHVAALDDHLVPYEKMARWAASRLVEPAGPALGRARRLRIDVPLWRAALL
jgi:LacI family transcriptional regulator